MSDIVILGGGVSGLSAGIYSLLNGHKVTICEQHKIAGGSLTGWNRKGYHIDNCIHWLTGTNKHSGLYKIWEDLGALGDDVRVIQLDKMYTYEKDGQSVSFWRDVDRMIDEMKAVSPKKDHRRIEKFGKAVKKSMYLSNVGGENHDKKGNIFRKISAGLALLRYNRYSVVDFGMKFESPAMQGFFSSLTGPTFSMAAFVFVAAAYCSDNGGLPEGGSLAMANRLVDKFKSLGGNLLTGKRAKTVNMKGKRAESVTFEDGETIKADKIIITFDPKMIFGKVLNAKLPNPFKKLYDSKAFHRFSSIHAAFAVDADAVPFHDSVAFDIPEDLQEVLKSSQCVLREFSHEKKFAPEGKNIIQTMIYTDESNATRLVRMAKDRVKYKEEKERLLQAQIELIERQVPELAGKISSLDSWTPATYARYVGSEIGSFMAFAMPVKRLPLSIKCRIDHIPNVFLATQWQMTPGGLPMAAQAGKKAAQAIGSY